MVRLHIPQEPYWATSSEGWICQKLARIDSFETGGLWRFDPEDATTELVSKGIEIDEMKE